MTTNARKTDAQRLGNGKKAFNVKQVEKMIEQGGGGTEYTAGTGITIADDTISVDEQTVAMKSELPDMDDYQPKLTAIDPINIVNDEINLKDWARYTENGSLLKDSNNALVKDIIIRTSVSAGGSAPNMYNFFYLPKGVNVRNVNLVVSYSRQREDNNSSVEMGYITLNDIFVNSPIQVAVAHSMNYIKGVTNGLLHIGDIESQNCYITVYTRS